MKFNSAALNELINMIDSRYFDTSSIAEANGNPEWISYSWNSFFAYEESDLVFLNSIIKDFYTEKPNKLIKNAYYSFNVYERLEKLQKKPKKDSLDDIYFLEQWCPARYGSFSHNIADSLASYLYKINKKLKIKKKDIDRARDLIQDKWYKKTDTLSKNLHAIKVVYEQGTELNLQLENLEYKIKRINFGLINRLIDGENLEDIEFNFED